VRVQRVEVVEITSLPLASVAGQEAVALEEPQLQGELVAARVEALLLRSIPEERVLSEVEVEEREQALV
jgi:hypothetical protein